MLIINFVFAVMAGVVLSAVFAFEWGIFTFFIGFGLWNVMAAGIVLVAGFVFGNRIEGGY
jgi:hypothetical protein